MRYKQIKFVIDADPPLLQVCKDILAAVAARAGLEAFEDNGNCIIGYAQTTIFDEEVLSAIINSFPIDGVIIYYTIEDAEYKDWNEQWENEGFPPINVGNITIHDGRHLPQFPGGILVEIDAKQAFGTGNHETTQLILSQLQNMDLKNMSILDCGCGTGILGIVCKKLGASHVLGYDIDEWSVDNTRHNTIINDVEKQFTILHGDINIIPTTLQFDVILANINRNIILADMHAFPKMMKKEATLIVSGFLEEDVSLLKETAEQYGLHHIAQQTLNHWSMLKFHNHK